MAVNNHTDALVEAIAEAVARRIGPLPGQRRLLSVDQAGEYLSRTSMAIRKMIAAGRLHPVHIDSRVFLDIHDLNKLIDDCKV